MAPAGLTRRGDHMYFQYINLFHFWSCTHPSDQLLPQSSFVMPSVANLSNSEVSIPSHVGVHPDEASKGKGLSVPTEAILTHSREEGEKEYR